MSVISVESLRKRYGSVTAVDGIDLHVQPGEVFGLLGPNGAGKTTTLEIIQGLRTPDEGKIKVLGLDPFRQHSQLHQKMGVQLQASSLFPKLKVEETLKLFASYYKRRVDIQHLMETFSLLEKRKAYVKALSGGQKQRLAMALAFIHDPEVVILDEPTVGLDAQSRLNLWDIIKQYRSAGKTILLATHNMDEAQELCDRIAILDSGRVIELDTPDALIGRYHRAAASGESSPARDLEDVFLALTGRRLRD